MSLPASPRPGLTPSQTVGPFLAIGLPWPDGPFVVPEGTPGAVSISGRVLDGAAEPVPDALVETWQAAPDGSFAHPDDPRGPRHYPGFRGFGRCPTSRAAGTGSSRCGRARCRSPGGGTEAPHLDVSVFARGLLDRVVTRIYFPDETAANAADPVLAAIDAGPAGDSVATAEPGAGRFALPSTSGCRAAGRRCFSMSEPSMSEPVSAGPQPVTAEPAGPLRLESSLDGPPGAPVLVLGNSIGTTRAVWDPQAAALQEHFRLLRFDYPGHGGSPAPPGPYSIADLAAGVLGLLGAHRVGRAAYCGISLGGMVGIWLAAHTPERIAALGLCCTSAYLPPAAMWADRAALVRASGMGPVADEAAGRWFTPAFQRRDPAAVVARRGRDARRQPGRLRRLLRGDPAAWTSGPRSARSPRPRLSSPAPRIRRRRRGTARSSRRGIAGARLRVIRGASHLASISQPGEVTALLLAHLLAR